MARKPPITLTRLENEVMQAVWSLPGRAVRVRDVCDALNKGLSRGRRKPLAYTTVQTVLNILRDKGALEVTPGEGRAHLYRARLSRDTASRGMLRDLVDRLFDGRVKPLLEHLVEDEQLSDDDLRALREMVAARLKDRGEGRP